PARDPQAGTGLVACAKRASSPAADPSRAAVSDPRCSLDSAASVPKPARRPLPFGTKLVRGESGPGRSMAAEWRRATSSRGRTQRAADGGTARYARLGSTPSARRAGEYPVVDEPI